jgi:hypothetical protein
MRYLPCKCKWQLGGRGTGYRFLIITRSPDGINGVTVAYICKSSFRGFPFEARIGNLDHSFLLRRYKKLNEAKKAIHAYLGVKPFNMGGEHNERRDEKVD